MAEGRKLADAYVSVIPEAKGIKGKLSNVLGKDTKSAADSAGKSSGETFVKKMIGIVAAAKIGQTVVEGIKKSLEAGAALEQAVGGIQTLFGDAADTMIGYAGQAWKTAGLDATSYMETTTSFAASMLQSVGGDSAKAAELSNAAVIAMADNANKMGTDMGSIQQAYQGFAKQNYTMLDNLKLGYGGTKTEMERLIHDASQMTDVQEKLGVTVEDGNLSFGNITQAIQVMQDHLGIAGTTAIEAADTFSGSFAAMQSAWGNVLATLSGKDTGGLTIEQAMADLATSASTFFFNNFLPAMGNIITQLPGAIATFIQTAIPLIVENGKAIVQSLIEGWKSHKGEWATNVNDFLDSAIAWIEESLPEILDRGVQAVENFIAGWGSGDGHMMTTVGTLIGKILVVIAKAMPQILLAGVKIVGQLALGLIKNMPYFLSQAGRLLKQMLQTIASHFPQMMSSGGKLVLQLVTGVLGAVPRAVSAMLSLGRQMIAKLKSTNWASVGKHIISGIINGLLGAAGRLFTSLKNLATTALQKAKEAFKIGSPSRLFAEEVGKWIPPGIAQGIEKNQGALDSLWSKFSANEVALAGEEFRVNARSMNTAVARDTVDLASTLNNVMSLLNQYLPDCANTRLYLDGDTLVGKTVDKYDSALGIIASRRERGLA